MYIYIHTYIRTYIHTYIQHTYIHTYTYFNTCSSMHTCTHICIHIYVPRMNTKQHTQACMDTYIHASTLILTYIHAYIDLLQYIRLYCALSCKHSAGYTFSGALSRYLFGGPYLVAESSLPRRGEGVRGTVSPPGKFLEKYGKNSEF